MTETKKDDLAAVRAERDQLRRENDALRRQLDAAPAAAPGAAPGTPAARPVPHAPSFGLSEGERADLEQRGVSNSPWTGEQSIADDHGIEALGDDAKAAQDRARRRREQRGEQATTTTTTAGTATRPASRPVRDAPGV